MTCSMWAKKLVKHMSNEMCYDVLVTILRRFGWVAELTEEVSV